MIGFAKELFGIHFNVLFIYSGKERKWKYKLSIRLISDSLRLLRWFLSHSDLFSNISNQMKTTIHFSLSPATSLCEMCTFSSRFSLFGLLWFFFFLLISWYHQTLIPFPLFFEFILFLTLRYMTFPTFLLYLAFLIVDLPIQLIYLILKIAHYL